VAAGGAAVAAGAINALAGGGTLISFPTLVGLGVPPVPANVTNTVALVPGYVAGTWAQKDDLKPQLEHSRPLAAVAAAGGLGGSILLVVIPAEAFRTAIPYLILLSCALLFFQERLRKLVMRSHTPGPRSGSGTGAASATMGQATHWRVFLLALVFLASIYGGFFGAGLGIVFLAILGLFTTESLVKVNALKQALSFVVNVVAAVFFAFSGHVVWILVPVMAVASVAGGGLGGRLAKVVNSDVLRGVVVVIGLGVAVAFWVT
jgi:uncharacterized protein